MTTEITRRLLAGLPAPAHLISDALLFRFADFCAAENITGREGYLAFTAELKSAINALAQKQKESWKNPHVASEITFLISIRRASKVWAASCYVGDPLMLHARARTAKAAQKTLLRAKSRMDHLSRTHSDLKDQATQMMNRAADLERQAEIAMRDARRARERAEKLELRCGVATYEADQAQNAASQAEQILKRGQDQTVAQAA